MTDREMYEVLKAEIIKLKDNPYFMRAIKDVGIINTLKVKEVDLEKEIKNYFNNQPIITRSKGVDYQLIPSGEEIAKHFFELGTKVQKEEDELTWEDISNISECLSDVKEEIAVGQHKGWGIKELYQEALERFKEKSYESKRSKK